MSTGLNIRKEGALDFLAKPVDPDHLLAVMEQWMRGE